MKLFKAIFGGDPEGIEIEKADDFSVDYRLEGQFPYTSSAVFLTAYTKTKSEAVIPIAATFSWFRLVDGTEHPIVCSGGSYFFSALDVHSRVKVVIRATDSDSGGRCVIQFGPILLDPVHKFDLYDLASNSDGILIPVFAVKTKTFGRNNLLEKPNIYIFENYFKIVGTRRDGQSASIRYGFNNTFEMESCSNSDCCFTLRLNQSARLFEALGVPEESPLELQFESTESRDRAILCLKIFPAIHLIRNEVILSKILPLIPESKTGSYSELIEINKRLANEIMGVKKQREKDLDGFLNPQNNPIARSLQVKRRPADARVEVNLDDSVHTLVNVHQELYGDELRLDGGFGAAQDESFSRGEPGLYKSK